MRPRILFTPTRAVSHTPRPESPPARAKDPQDRPGQKAPTEKGAPSVAIRSVKIAHAGDRKPWAAGTATRYSRVTVTWPDDTKSVVTADADGDWCVQAEKEQCSGVVAATASTGERTSDPSERWYVDDSGPMVTKLEVIGADLKVSTNDKQNTLTVFWPNGDVTYHHGYLEHTIEIRNNQPTGTIKVIAEKRAGGLRHRGPPKSVSYTDKTPPGCPKFEVCEYKKSGRAEATGKGAEPGSTAVVTWPDKSVDREIVGPGKKWSVVSKNAQPAGNVSVFFEDAAGNTSASRIEPFTPDKPDGLDIKITSVGDADRDGRPWAIGTSSPRATVRVTWPDRCTRETTADARGNWELKADQPQDAGVVRAYAADGNGNKSASDAFDYQG